MKFRKILDREGRRRRKIAANALARIRTAAEAEPELGEAFAKASGVTCGPNESWPAANARLLGLTLPQLRATAAGTLETGHWAFDRKPTDQELHQHFVGWAILLVETERQLAAEGNKTV
jgi:hypothetical protein